MTIKAHFSFSSFPKIFATFFSSEWASYWTTRNFLPKLLFTTDFETPIFLKKSFQTAKSWSEVVWRQSRCWSKWDSLKNPLLEQRTIPTCRKYGSRKNCSHPKSFWAGTITKTLSQHWRLCRKWLSFITTKVLICASLDVHCLTWPTFACTVSPVQSFIHSQKATKICFQNFGKMGLEDRQKCSNVKLLLTRPTSASPEMFASRLFKRMLVNFNLTQWVNPKLQDSTQGISLMQISKDSSPVRTNLKGSNYGNVVFSTNETGLQNSQLFLIKNLEKTWLLQCRWVLWAMKHTTSSNGLLLFLLYLSRGTTCSNWRRRSAWHRKEEIGWNAETVCAEKGCSIVKMWECEMRKLYKTDMSVKEQLRESITYKRPMRQHQLLFNKKSGAFSGYVQCDIKVPEHLREQFAKFPPVFQIYKRIYTRFWTIIARVCWEERVNVPMSANSNFWGWDNQWHYHYSHATTLLATGTRWHKISTICLV